MENIISFVTKKLFNSMELCAPENCSTSVNDDDLSNLVDIPEQGFKLFSATVSVGKVGGSTKRVITVKVEGRGCGTFFYLTVTTPVYAMMVSQKLFSMISNLADKITQVSEIQEPIDIDFESLYKYEKEFNQMRPQQIFVDSYGRSILDEKLGMILDHSGDLSEQYNEIINNARTVTEAMENIKKLNALQGKREF